jgi:hypothetical protein
MESTFMDPKKFVHLLSDEASFPRSRFYFWAIGCLTAFEDEIAVNVREVGLLESTQAIAWKPVKSFM